MSLYLLIKFLHVLLASIAIGFNASYPIWLARANQEPEHALWALRGIKPLDDRFANPAYGLLLVLGLAITWWIFTQARTWSPPPMTLAGLWLRDEGPTCNCNAIVTPAATASRGPALGGRSETCGAGAPFRQSSDAGQPASRKAAGGCRHAGAAANPR